MSSSPHTLSVTLTSRTDLEELKQKLVEQTEQKHPIHTALVRLDASFLLRLPTTDDESSSSSNNINNNVSDDHQESASSAPEETETATAAATTSTWQHRIFTVLGRGLPRLKKLSIWGPFSASVTMAILTSFLENQGSCGDGNLGYLSINHMRLSGDQAGYSRFTNTIQQYYMGLKEIRLSGVSFDTDDVRLQWMQVLAQLPRLQTVAISGTTSTQLYSAIHAPSVSALFASTTIRKVVLFSLVFDDDETASVLHAFANSHNTSIQEASLGLTGGRLGGPALAHLLRNNATLEKLWVRVNNLEDDPQNKNFAEALRTAHHLQEFGLYGERYVSSKSVTYFVDMLQEDNTTLKQMELQSSEFSDDLEYLLQLNRIGRRELLQGDFSHSRNEWVEALSRAQDDLSCIFYLLNTNPNLCSGVAST